MNTTMIKPGTLLIAHPDLDDEFFQFSTVLITEDHQQGTTGLCVNKLTDMSLSEAAGLSDWAGTEELYTGGPVNARALIMIHSADWYSSNTMPVTTEFSISSDLLMTEKISTGNEPRDYRFVNGVSSWKPKQLSEEIAQGKWLTMPATEAIVYEYTGETQWKKAINNYAELAVAQYF